MNAPIKINCGCADLPLPHSEGWINIDISTSQRVKSDMTIDFTRLDEHFEPESVSEIYAGHALEHLTPNEVVVTIMMWKKLLKKGGKIGIVTPDFMEICREYIRGNDEFSIEQLNDRYIYSYCQESLHRSVHDLISLRRLLTSTGFSDVVEIDRFEDKRLAFPNKYQCGMEGIKL